MRGARMSPWERGVLVAIMSGAISTLSLAQPGAFVSDVHGSWRSEADPRSVFMITRGAGARSVRIVTAGAFEAVGFAEGPTVVALIRPTPVNGSSWSQHGSVVRLQRTSEDTMSIAFARELQGEPTKEDRWFRLASKSTETQIPAPVAPRTPGLGEYQYVEELPEALERVPPVYSAEMREKRLEGTVVVQALVGRQGEVVDVKVTKSIPGLDDAAVAAVRRWKFKPALSEGKPVAVWVAVPVKFSFH